MPVFIFRSRGELGSTIRRHHSDARVFEGVSPFFEGEFLLPEFPLHQEALVRHIADRDSRMSTVRGFCSMKRAIFGSSGMIVGGGTGSSSDSSSLTPLFFEGISPLAGFSALR